MPFTSSHNLTDEPGDTLRASGGKVSPPLGQDGPRPLATDFAGAAKMSPLSRSALYLAAARGELPVHKWGARAIIMVADLENYLRSLPLGSFKIPPSHQARADRKGTDRQEREEAFAPFGTAIVDR